MTTVQQRDDTLHIADMIAGKYPTTAQGHQMSTGDVDVAASLAAHGDAEPSTVEVVVADRAWFSVTAAGARRLRKALTLATAVSIATESGDWPAELGAEPETDDEKYDGTLTIDDDRLPCFHRNGFVFIDMFRPEASSHPADTNLAPDTPSCVIIAVDSDGDARVEFGGEDEDVVLILDDDRAMRLRNALAEAILFINDQVSDTTTNRDDFALAGNEARS